MISTIVSRLVILVFGTLYPAYASYKAVRTKNIKEYVKWMMYWIVFALFTCAETFTDVFLSWFPFYYEIKIILVLWLLSPATKGSSILYRKFVHPMLSRREQEIDDYIAKAKEQGYHTVLNLGTRSVNYATTVIMQTALKGGGGLVNQLRKSYSLSDLSDESDSRTETRSFQEQIVESNIDVLDARLVRRKRSPRRSSSGSSRVNVYFPEVDVRPDLGLSHVRSTEDVSSGYSSAEPLYAAGGQISKSPPIKESLMRTSSVGGSSRPRTRTTRMGATTKRTVIPEDNEYLEDSENDSETTIIEYISRRILKKPKVTQVEHKENDDSTSESDDVFLDSIEFETEESKHQTECNVEIKINDEVKELEIKNKDVKKVKNKNVLSVNTDLKTSSTSLLSQRGGRYNKNLAPIPPDKKNQEIDSHPIKATLVLKPGLMKSLSSKEQQIFVSHPSSPKLKRKSSKQHESPISRLMMLPKRIFGAHKHSPKGSEQDLVEEKRKSWHGDIQMLSPYYGFDVKSKSDTEGSQEQLDCLRSGRKAASDTGINELSGQERFFMLRTLSHSPKQLKRRNKREENAVEESD